MMIHSFVLWDQRKGCRHVAASTGRPRPQDALPSGVPNAQGPPGEGSSSPTRSSQHPCCSSSADGRGPLSALLTPHPRQNQAGKTACPAGTRLDTLHTRSPWAGPRGLALGSGRWLGGPRALLAGPHGCVGVTPAPPRHGTARQWGHVAASEPLTL